MRTEQGAGTTDQECIDHAVFRITGTIGPEELFPVLLVLIALLTSEGTTPVPTKLERAQLIEYTMKEMKK